MPPEIQQISHQQLIINQAYSVDLTISNTPTTVTVEGLLEGFVYSFNTTTGVLTIYGTPKSTSENKTWDVTAINSNDESTYVITYSVVHITPVISSTATQTFRHGSSYDLDIDISNDPNNVSARGYLLGLTHKKTETGINISGTIDSDANFTVSGGDITVTAKNTGGTHVYDVNYGLSTAPVFNNIPTHTLYLTVDIELDASDYIFGFPVPTYFATGLPSGITVNSAGVFSGSPTNIGEVTSTIFANNSEGNDSTTIVFNTLSEPVSPSLTSISAQSLNVNSSFSYTVTATGSPLPTFSATNLPAGVSINETSGVISGNPTMIETKNVVITATNVNPITDVTNTDSQTVVFTVNPELTVPILDAISDMSFTSNNAITPFSVSATAYPAATFSASGLPDGLSINSTSGQISGTPTRTDEGSNTVTITASNMNGNDIETFTITINNIPVIEENIRAQALAVGSAYSETFNIDGSTPITVTVTNLPGGLTHTFINNTLTISGTPTTIEGPTVTITATNTAGSDTTDVVFNVGASFTVPVLAVIPNQTVTADEDFSYTVTSVANPPSTYSAANLPAGITINSETGVISGQADRDAQASVIVLITATNHQGSHQRTFTFTVNAIPIITQVSDLSYNSGTNITAFTPSVDAFPNPTFTSTNLPENITINNISGEISGTPNRTGYGVNNVTITATNSVGSHTISFNITINTSPKLNFINDISFTAGTAITPFTVSTSTDTFPTATFSETNLPEGLTINAVSGQISGTPTRTDQGINEVIITGLNSAGSGEERFDITINAIPLIPLIPQQTSILNIAYSQSFTINGNTPFTVSTTGLPTGITASISGSTLTFSGTITTLTNSGNNNVSVTVSNAYGSDTETFVLFVTDAIPMFALNGDRLIVQIDSLTDHEGTAIIEHTLTLNASVSTAQASNYSGIVVDNDDIYYVNASNNRISVGNLSTTNNGTSTIERSLSALPSGFSASDIRDMDIEGNDLYIAFESSGNSGKRILIVNKNTGTEVRRFTSQTSLGDVLGMTLHGDYLYMLNDRIGGADGTPNTLYRTSKNSANNSTQTFTALHTLASVLSAKGIAAYNNRMYVSDASQQILSGTFVFGVIRSFPIDLTTVPTAAQTTIFALPETFFIGDAGQLLDISFDRSL